jgi:hypothetical protein
MNIKILVVDGEEYTRNLVSETDPAFDFILKFLKNP